MVKVRKDLTGKKFGRLTVIKQAEDYVNKNGSREAQWLCKCDCDNPNFVVVTGHRLKGGNTKSCGCLMIEKSRETIMNYNKTKYNTYDLSGEYGIGYTTKGEEFWFDLEDYDKIKDYCWYINSEYVVAKLSNGKHIKLHKLLIPEAIEIDHKNHKNFDNRKSNLRITNHQKNMMNRKKNSNNTSGVTGVYFNKHINKWIAEITVNKIHITLGSYKCFEDVVKARKEAEEKYFGEYSYDNSIKEVVL